MNRLEGLFPLFLGGVLVFPLASPKAQTAPPLDAVRVAGGFSLPLFVTAPQGDTSRIFVVEQGGKIRIIKLPMRTVNWTPFLDISSEFSLSGEEGLLEGDSSGWLSHRITPRAAAFMSTIPHQADPSVKV